MKNKLKKYKSGSELKTVPSGAKGLAKLPTEVRNRMGYMKMGGTTLKKRAEGGSTDDTRPKPTPSSGPMSRSEFRDAKKQIRQEKKLESMKSGVKRDVSEGIRKTVEAATSIAGGVTALRSALGKNKGSDTPSEKNGGERKLLSKMAMGGTFDLSDEFVEKMKKGGDMVRTSYKYGGGMTKQKYKMGGYVEPKKMQIGGSMQSRVNAKKVGKKK